MVTRARGPARRDRPSCSPSCPPLRPASSSPSSHSLRPEWRPAPLPASFPGGLIEPWAAWTDTRRQERPSKGAPLPGPGALAACFPLAFFFFFFFLACYLTPEELQRHPPWGEERRAGGSAGVGGGGRRVGPPTPGLRARGRRQAKGRRRSGRWAATRGRCASRQRAVEASAPAAGLGT